jgi:hypothetical protein
VRWPAHAGVAGDAAADWRWRLLALRQDWAVKGVVHWQFLEVEGPETEIRTAGTIVTMRM